MKLNRTLVMCLTIALCATIAIGGSMAYLTSTAGNRNVMTVGNVEIEQHEQQREILDDGTISTDLELFEDSKTMLPAYYPGDEVPEYDGTVTVNGEDYPIWENAVDGVVDKIVTVENKGSEAMYVRTLVAFEHTDPNNDTMFDDSIANQLHWNANCGEGTAWTLQTFEGQELDTLVIGDKYWRLVAFIHDEAVPPMQNNVPSITAPNLMQVFFDPSVDGDALALVGDEYEILVLSQAVQAQMGNLSASDALSTAFADLIDDNADTIAQWFVDANLVPTTTNP